MNIKRPHHPHTHHLLKLHRHRLHACVLVLDQCVGCITLTFKSEKTFPGEEIAIKYSYLFMICMQSFTKLQEVGSCSSMLYNPN